MSRSRARGNRSNVDEKALKYEGIASADVPPEAPIAQLNGSETPDELRRLWERGAVFADASEDARLLTTEEAELMMSLENDVLNGTMAESAAALSQLIERGWHEPTGATTTGLNLTADATHSGKFEISARRKAGITSARPTSTFPPKPDDLADDKNLGRAARKKHILRVGALEKQARNDIGSSGDLAPTFVSISEEGIVTKTPGGPLIVEEGPKGLTGDFINTGESFQAPDRRSATFEDNVFSGEAPAPESDPASDEGPRTETTWSILDR